ncbi:response regulator transcription factor [Paenibacillus endoradicis]|uniref:response regulator transcription factor n=1 Tax=Paenibacillus endoradicis TaxID=2972487 RepID=UPI002158F0DE|nr:response regulator transcription factor [Paenibacillus endoradicis]MCR8658531.1 response regulator transcription factor [Paenibacillus endoradicis]
MKEKILLVEDEEITREGIAEFLTVKGYHVVAVGDGAAAINVFESTQDFDLIILDIMLPKADGFEVLHTIRKYSQTSVLMLTAMDDEYTQIMSFDEQADDYMSKPFSLAVLEKRIEALLRRSKPIYTKKIWMYKDSKVDFSGYSATYQDLEVDIKPKEIKLLHLLIEHSGQTLTRDQILDRLWESEEAPIDRVIDVYIKNLRKKLYLDCIKTVKGLGYKYEESV